MGLIAAFREGRGSARLHGQIAALELAPALLQSLGTDLRRAFQRRVQMGQHGRIAPQLAVFAEYHRFFLPQPSSSGSRVSTDRPNVHVCSGSARPVSAATYSRRVFGL